MTKFTEKQIGEHIKTGKMTPIELEMIPLYKIEKELESLGFERMDDINPTNGWQVDFWYEYKSEKWGNWTVSGSLWYGDFKLERNDA